MCWPVAALLPMYIRFEMHICKLHMVRAYKQIFVTWCGPRKCGPATQIPGAKQWSNDYILPQGIPHQTYNFQQRHNISQQALGICNCKSAKCLSCTCNVSPQRHLLYWSLVFLGLWRHDLWSNMPAGTCNDYSVEYESITLVQAKHHLISATTHVLAGQFLNCRISSGTAIACNKYFFWSLMPGRDVNEMRILCRFVNNSWLRSWRHEDG